MQNKLKQQLKNPVITSAQQKLLFAGLKVGSFIFRGIVVLVLFVALVLIGHFTGFEQWVRVLTGLGQPS